MRLPALKSALCCECAVVTSAGGSYHFYHPETSAGTDFDGKNAANKDLFGGGAGAGVNIQPVAFLVVKDGCGRTIQLSDGANTVDRALTMIPELVEKVSVLIDRKGGKAAPAETGPEAPNA